MWRPDREHRIHIAGDFIESPDETILKPTGV